MPGSADASVAPGVERTAVLGVAELLTRAAQGGPDRTALVEASGRRLTWRELDEEVDRVAAGLGAAGIVAGRRVLVAMGNRIEFVVLYLAVLRLQAVAVPVNPTSSVDELTRMIEDSGSRLVVADETTVAACREAIAARSAAGGQVVLVALDAPGADDAQDTGADGVPVWPFERLRAESGRTALPVQDPDRLAALLYTSGTSGRPRAAMLTHRALLANVEQLARVDPPMVHGDDVVLGVLPLFHVYGLGAVLGSVLRHGARLVIAPRFDVQGTLDLIDDEACSVAPLAPPVFAHWLGLDGLRERLGSLRLVLSGSAPLAASVAEAFTRATGIPVHQGYGLTEASPVVTSTLASADPRPGSVGAPLPGVEVRLVDDSGRAPEGEDPGEIWVRGPNLFSGYWPDGADGPDVQGWWATGDVGLLDAGGDLVLVDRVKELVIVSGFNVYPSEVEDVVREVPGVGEAAVIGVADDRTGEAVVAYVVPATPGSSYDDLATAVEEHCARRVARFKRPSRVEVVPELPVGVTGKVQKGRLRGLERRRRLGLLE